MTWEINLLGALIAFVFVMSMVSLFWWMLRVPPQVSPEAARARRSLDAFGVILVPIIGEAYSLQAVELACRLGETAKAEIVLSAFLEMPFSLPMEAPVPEAEAQAQALLDQARAVVEEHSLGCTTRIERGREAAEGILALARRGNVGLVVLGVTPKPLGAGSALGRTAELLLRRAPCEVILDRAVT